jgi:hypothetical protein
VQRGDQIVPQLLAAPREVLVVECKSAVVFNDAQTFGGTVDVGIEHSERGQLVA